MERDKILPLRRRFGSPVSVRRGRPWGTCHAVVPRFPQVVLAFATAVVLLFWGIEDSSVLARAVWISASMCALVLAVRIGQTAVIVTSTHLIVRAGISAMRHLDDIASVSSEISEDRIVALLWSPVVRVRSGDETELRPLMGYSLPSSRNARVDRQSELLREAVARR